MEKEVQGAVETSPEVLKIEKVIAQSQASLAGETENTKRSRGRPRGSLDKKSRKKLKKAAKQSVLQAEEPFNPAEFEPEILPEARPMPDYTPFIKPAIQFPFDVIAVKTGFDGFKLSDDERDGLAPQIQEVLRQYVPAEALNSPNAPAFALAASIIFLGATKYMAYQSWLKDQGPKNTQADQPQTELSAVPDSIYPVEAH